MNKSDVFEKMINSENGGLYAAIGGIALVYGMSAMDLLIFSAWKLSHVAPFSGGKAA